MEGIFGRQLSWRETVAMAVLLTAVVLLTGLDIRAWQERHSVQAQLVEAGPVEEALEFFPEPGFLDQAAFVGWVTGDLSDEDNGILNLQE